MKRLLTVALAVLFVTSLSGLAVAERTALSIDGSIEIMSRYQENIDINRAGGNLGPHSVGSNSMDNRVEQKVNLNVDADMTDNVSGHIGLEMDFVWGDDGVQTGAPAGENTFGINDDRVALQIDEAYVKIDEFLMEELSITAGVLNVEYSLRDDGNATFLSVPEIGAFKATLDYDPLYVDLLIGKLTETRSTVATDDLDAYAIVVEYYLENESKIQVIIASVASETNDVSASQYSAGVTYNVSDDLEIFAELGGQGGEWGDGNDLNQMAFNVGAEYTFSNVNLTPYVGISYQSFGGDDTDENWVNVGDTDATIVLEADGDLRDNNLGPVGKILTSNYSVIRLVGGCQIDEKTALDAQIAFFSVTDDDAVLGDSGVFNGTVLANGAGDTDIGTEIDIKVTHQLTDDLEVGLGIGYVACGDVIENSNLDGEDDALIVIAANAVLTF